MACLKVQLSFQNQNYSFVALKSGSSGVDAFEASQDVHRVVYSEIKSHRDASDSEDKHEKLCIEQQEQVSRVLANKRTIVEPPIKDTLKPAIFSLC